MKKTRYFILLLLFFILPFNVFAKEDTLKIGMEVNYSPYNFSQTNDKNNALEVVNSKGEYANGYDVQMAKLIAEKLHKKAEIVKVEWDGLAPALTSGKIDCIIAGMSPTKERKKEIDFTDNYYNSNLVLVIKKDSNLSNAVSLLDFKGKKITGQLNTFHYDIIDQIEGVDKVEAMESFPSMISALKAGKIDGYVSEKPGALAAISSNKDLSFVEFEDGKGFETDSENTSIAVGVKKNSPLKDQINEALRQIDQNKRDEIMNEMVILSEQGEESSSFLGQMKEIVKEYYPLFLKGIKNTMLIAVLSTIFGFMLGLIVAILRKLDVNKSKNPVGYIFSKILNLILQIYVEIFRGTPMMVQAMLIFYGSKQFLDIDMNSMFAALFIVSINTGAYLSEVVRGGINSIDKGQFEACKSLGLTHLQTMFNVIIPQTVKSILPAIGNEFVINIKDTSVLNVISVTELFFMSKSIAGSTYKIFQTYLVCAIIYFVLTFITTRVILYIEKRYNNREYTLESSTGGLHVRNN